MKTWRNHTKSENSHKRVYPGRVSVNISALVLCSVIAFMKLVQKLCSVLSARMFSLVNVSLQRSFYIFLDLNHSVNMHFCEHFVSARTQ